MDRTNQARQALNLANQKVLSVWLAAALLGGFWLDLVAAKKKIKKRVFLCFSFL